MPAQLQRIAAPVRSSPLRLLSCVRWREVAILQGTPLMGLVFAMGRMRSSAIVPVLVFAVASFCLVAHIWTLNDWTDGRADGLDPNKTSRSFVGRGIAGSTFLCLSLLFLGIAFGLFVLLPLRTFVMAAAVALLGLCYSLPRFGLKQMPLAAGAIHLMGGGLHFLLGYSALAPLGPRAFMLAGFFGLVFAAGHSTQEVQDWSSDRHNGTRTAAVRLGPRTVFAAAAVIFVLAYLYLFFLGLSGWAPLRLAVLVVPLLPLQTLWFIRAWRSGLGFDQVSFLRERYRLLFGVIGLGIASTLFI